VSASIMLFDERRDIVLPGDAKQTVAFCVERFFLLAKKNIEQDGYFAVALSGGNTPKAIYQKLSKDPRVAEIDWERVFIFFSDERAVPPDSPESNYRMAMEAGFSQLPIPAKNIFRMSAETEIDSHARLYEQEILSHLRSGKFSLVMLGMGDDGHTASLFPETHGLHVMGRLVTANFIPKKNSWRMTLTFECINQAKEIDILVIGKEKAPMVKKVLTGPYQPNLYPVQRVGTPEHRALWILDAEAASELKV